MDAKTFLDELITKEEEKWSKEKGYKSIEQPMHAKRVLEKDYLDELEKQTTAFCGKKVKSQDREIVQLYDKLTDLFYLIGYIHPSILSNYPNKVCIRSNLTISRVTKLEKLSSHLEPSEAERFIEIETKARDLYKKIGDAIKGTNPTYLPQSNCNMGILYNALCELDSKPKNSIDF